MKTNAKKINPLDKLGDFDIQESFETSLRDATIETGVGFFSAEVDRDEKGIKIIVRVAAMVDTAGTEDFTKKDNLRQVTVDFPDGRVVYQVVEVVNVSGMEIEVVYRPLL